MKKILFLVFALILSGMASFMVYKQMLLLEDRAKRGAGPQGDVVVAAADLSARKVIASQDLMVVKMSLAAIQADALKNVQQAVGKVSRVEIFKGQQLLSRHVTEDATKIGLAISIPPGRRAVSIAIDDVIGVGNQVRPGDRVDVIATVKMEDMQATATILQDILVLAIGNQLNVDQSASAIPNPTAKRMPGSSTATLALDVMEAEKLSLAEESGTVRLSLRPVTPEGVIDIKPIGIADLIGAMAEAPPEITPEPQPQPVVKPEPPKKKPYIVELVTPKEKKEIELENVQ